MKSFTKTAIATTLLASSVSAQSQYTIDPNTVSNDTRNYWCEQQISECPLICLDQGASGSTTSNDCQADSLTYSCVCDNGLSPNVSQYSQTLPYFICTEWGTQCVSNCGGDTTCGAACRQDHPCGASNPTRQNTSTLSRTMSATASTTASAGPGRVTTDTSGSTVTLYSGLAGASSTGGGSGSSSGASKAAKVWALSAGQTFGTLGVMGAAALGFAVLL